MIVRKEDITYKVFVDFDGTITKDDVGEKMFLRFGNQKKAFEIIEQWIDEKISSTESWEQLCLTIKDLNRNEFDKFIDEIEIDDYFLRFKKFCDLNKIKMFVLSDGLDYYIKKILERKKLDDLTFYSNHLEFTENGISASFPHTDEECKKCANCKRNHLISNSADNDITIYIGDGYSDTCPAQFADFIFAKKSLLKYCEKSRISYFPYETFLDVERLMTKIISKNKIRKRHQAILNRKSVYIQG